MKTDYSLELRESSSATFKVCSISLEESVNDSYRCTIVCRIAEARAESPQEFCNRLRGDTARLTIRRKFQNGEELSEAVIGIVHTAERTFSGFRTQVARAEEDPVGDETSDDEFTIQIGPAYDALAHHYERAGTYSGKTYAKRLIAELARALPGRRFTDRTKLDQDVDEIVYPQGTSMRDWARSLVDEAGQNYFFLHNAEEAIASASEEFVLVDTNREFEELVHPLGKDCAFRVQHAGAAPDQERISKATATAATGPKNVRVQSFHEAGDPELINESAVTNGRTEAVDVRWSPLRPAELTGEANPTSRHFAEVLAGRYESELNAVILEGNILGLRAGRRIKLELVKGGGREYVCVRLKAHGENPGQVETSEAYRCTATVVPLDADGAPIYIRPLDPVAPSQLSITMAKIVSTPENRPVETDKWHRCRLRYLWQDAKSEPAIVNVSVMQPMAGPFGGTQWLPREGDRVIVAHLLNNPRRALILGCVYDAHRPPPVLGPPERRDHRLPQSNRWLGWSYASIEGGKASLARHTMLAMHVTAEGELFYFRAPKDWRRDVDNDSEARITGNETITIGKSLSQKIGENRSEAVGKESTLTVGGNRSETITGNDSVTVTGGHLHRVEGKVSEHYGDYTCAVKGDLTTRVERGDRTDRVLSGSWNMRAGKSMRLNATSVSVSTGSGGGAGPALGASLALKNNAVLEGPSGAELRAGTSTVIAGTDGVVTRGTAVRSQDGSGGEAALTNGTYVVDAPQGVTLRCGATELRLAPEGLFLNGHRVSISATTTDIETDRLDVTGD